MVGEQLREIVMKTYIANPSRAKVLVNPKGSLYPCSEEQGLSSPFEPMGDE